MRVAMGRINLAVGFPDLRILGHVFGPQGLTRHIKQILELVIIRCIDHCATSLLSTGTDIGRKGNSLRSTSRFNVKFILSSTQRSTTLKTSYRRSASMPSLTPVDTKTRTTVHAFAAVS